MSKKWISILGLTLFVSFEVAAVAIHRPFYTLREKGMGGAISSSADDYSAVMYNPANMANMKEKNTNMGFGGSFNQGFFSFQSDLTSVATEQDAGAKLTKWNKFIADYENETFSLNPYFYGMISGPKYGFALIPLNTDFNVSVGSTALDINSYLDGVMLFGMGRKFNDKIDWGFTTKAIYRGYFSATFDQSSLVSEDLFNGDSANFGLTADVDFAVNYKLPKWKAVDPKVSVIVRNLLDLGFKFASTKVEPPKLQRSLDIGSEFKFNKLWVFQPRLMFDIRDIGIKDWDFQSGYHIGAELNWQTYDWLSGGYRVGLNQGYFTAGVDMQFAWFRLDLVSWGEEVGTKDNRKEMRRVALNMSLDF